MLVLERFSRESALLIAFRRNRTAVIGVFLLAFLFLVVLVGPYVAPDDPYTVGAGPVMQPPSLRHLMGTDQLGRDILSRVLWGARISVFVGLTAALGSTLIGVVLGTVSGYLGGLVDDVLGRVIEIFMSIPLFFLAMMTVAFFGADVRTMVSAIAILSWPTTARLVRAEFLGLRARQFVDAARVLGASNATIMFVEILPNAAGPIVVSSTLLVAQAMLLEASLSYLGLGDPNTISWGLMLFDAQTILQRAWWSAVFPGLGIFIAVLGLNLTGDGLADAINPRFRER